MTQVSLAEVVRLAAGNTELFGRTFFPETVRQPSPAFHKDIDELLDDRAHRHVAIEVFRGGAKTSKLRIYTAKRISYGLSRTILYVSETQNHAKKSIRWIRRRLETSKKWTAAFGLARGAIWTDEQIEIYHTRLGHPITLIALGITGQTRGINEDDYRPDLIVVDDPCNEENTATLEQREKIFGLFFGALEKSLTPATESPDAKMVLLQTPLNEEDLISRCHKDPQWASRRYGCFDDRGKSRWPERYPTQTLLNDKAGHEARNQMSLWLREMECKLVSAESSDFRPGWVKRWEEGNLPPLVYIIGVDPVPPPSDSEIAKGLHNKDFEAICVMGKDAFGKYYLVEYRTSRGHTPEWTSNTLFELVLKYKPIRVRVEAVAYQRTLEWFLRKQMDFKRHYFQLEPVTDRRKKRHRILQAYSGIASNGNFFIPPSGATEFVEQWTAHPYCSHDDVLDAGAMALDGLLDLEVEDLIPKDDPLVEEDWLQEGEPWRFAP